jgi:hypothetical protein
MRLVRGLPSGQVGCRGARAQWGACQSLERATTRLLPQNVARAGRARPDSAWRTCASRAQRRCTTGGARGAPRQRQRPPPCCASGLPYARVRAWWSCNAHARPCSPLRRSATPPNAPPPLTPACQSPRSAVRRKPRTQARRICPRQRQCLKCDHWAHLRSRSMAAVPSGPQAHPFRR